MSKVCITLSDVMKNPVQTLRLINRLRVARAERRLSQEELANLVGVTRQTISSIENDQYCPSTMLAFLLARALEQPVAGLFSLEEKGEME